MSGEERKLFLDKCNEKRNETWNKKYGGHPLNNSIVKNKIIETNNKKYGCDYLFQSKDFINNDEIKNKSKQTAIKNGFIIPDELLTPYEKYKNKCRKLTYKIKNELFENWNGHDYYDDEYIKDYLNLHNTDKRFPTIDHKKSIYYGFINNIPEEEICGIENLCITKRSINSSKRSKNDI
jgi:hypothetical protein